ncbi:hypothetical protein BD309DRAFT_965588, partial [Dichomitus squalens]
SVVAANTRMGRHRISQSCQVMLIFHYQYLCACAWTAGTVQVSVSKTNSECGTSTQLQTGDSAQQLELWPCSRDRYKANGYT